MIYRNNFPGLLVSDPREFLQDDSNTVMPLAMLPTHGAVPLMLPPGLLDYDPGTDGQGQAMPQAMPQPDMQNNGFANGLMQLALNKINLPVTPSGEPINMRLSPDPSQPDEGDDGLVVDGLRWTTGKLKPIRKPIPLPPQPPATNRRGQMIYDYPVLADREG